MMRATLSYQELGMEVTILLPLRKDRGAKSPACTSGHKPPRALQCLPLVDTTWSEESGRLARELKS